ncbi:MAG: aminoacyl-tRNA hydrolase [Anaerolineae bacterium]|nr:aminoacyl-tRNA hydrolase [Anaerolineae bacterium]MDW8171909.1 aminoacyl-tRNA hydrolase [Anaerolineae bacterium]
MSKHLIVGLGNPGRDYEQTRHNVGWWVLDALIARHNLQGAVKEKKAVVTSGVIGGKSVLLAKPQTYMNLSGEAVRALLDFYKLPLENLLVIHDDMDTPLGQIRLRRTGGHGGQNGVRNIILHVGTQDFARLRFGIGRPPGKLPARDYVLHPFVGDERILAQQMVDKAADAAEAWLSLGIDAAMNRVNGGEAEAKPSDQEQLAVLLRACELAPSDPKPLEALAKHYQKLRQRDDAIRTYERLAELYGEASPKQRAWAWEQVVRLDVRRYDLHERLAQHALAQGDSKRATQAWLRLAEVLQDAADWPAALRAVEEALRINPAHDRALAMRQAIEHRLLH